MLSYLCRVSLAWKEVSDIATGAYKVNTAKLGAHIISLMKLISEQSALYAIAKEPRR